MVRSRDYGRVKNLAEEAYQAGKCLGYNLGYNLGFELGYERVTPRAATWGITTALWLL